MTINELATQKTLKGLTCPYTGMPVSVRVIASGGQPPRFFSPDAYDPADPVDSLETALRLASRRNGVEGSVPPEKALFCAYTGKPLAITKRPDGYSLTGGFSPRLPVPSASLFNYMARMRGGVSPVEKPAFERVVISEAASDQPAASPVSQGPKDSSLEHAEGALKPYLPKRVSVRVDGRRQAKKG